MWTCSPQRPRGVRPPHPPLLPPHIREGMLHPSTPSGTPTRTRQLAPRHSKHIIPTSLTLKLSHEHLPSTLRRPSFFTTTSTPTPMPRPGPRVATSQQSRRADAGARFVTASHHYSLPCPCRHLPRSASARPRGGAARGDETTKPFQRLSHPSHPIIPLSPPPRGGGGGPLTLTLTLTLESRFAASSEVGIRYAEPVWRPRRERPASHSR